MTAHKLVVATLVLTAGTAALTAVPASAAVDSAPGRCVGSPLIRNAPSLGGVGIARCLPSHRTTAICKTRTEIVVDPGGAVTNVWYFITDHTITVQGFVSAAYYETDDSAVPTC
ncbi:hypothetical protein AB0P21_29265 [Kribbella sp. NPDC056861]|uniref:hypothetical protein n=1 Tax=Kribbella sp. NPDC056861 TaxID=3154857 RepID=UPI003444F44E